jgi:hypothetical protein
MIQDELPKIDGSLELSNICKELEKMKFEDEVKQIKDMFSAMEEKAKAEGKFFDNPYKRIKPNRHY